MPSSKRFKARPVIIEWNDAWEDQAAVDPADIEHKPVVQRTIGFLIRKDKKGATLATEYAVDGSGLRTTNFIPKGMIVSITPLTKK